MGTAVIDANSGAGFTHSSLIAWEASLPATLLEDEIALVRGDAPGGSTFFCNVTTAADKRIIFRAESGGEWYDSPATVSRMSQTSGSSWGTVNLDGACNHVLFEGISLRFGDSSQSPVRFHGVAGSVPADALVRLVDCYLSDTGGVPARVSNGVAGVKRIELSNCISRGGTVVANGGADTAANCTRWMDATATTFNGHTFRYFDVATRCAGFQSSGSWGDYLSVGTKVECVSQDGTGSPGFTGHVVEDQYTDPVNGDWSYKAGNALEGAGSGGQDIGFSMALVQTAAASAPGSDFVLGSAALGEVAFGGLSGVAASVPEPGGAIGALFTDNGVAIVSAAGLTFENGAGLETAVAIWRDDGVSLTKIWAPA